jgi:alcohol dehydrogenase (cytochrome c)
MIHKLRIIAVIVGAATVIGASPKDALSDDLTVEASIAAALTRNYFLTLNAPAGTTNTETNPAYKEAAAGPAPAGEAVNAAAGDWPSYNRTLASERFSPLSQINTKNVGKLRVLCTYDIGQFTAFESGLLMVNDALIGATEFDTFSLNPATCAENWRTHEHYPASIIPVNRGAAYMDGMLFRGTEDGRVLAYDFKTGKQIWATAIADRDHGESVPAAPIAWNGLVFVGNAGGDFKGGKGHMFALDAKTGTIVWEFFLVPKTEGDTVRGPLGKTALNTSSWQNAPGIPISGGGNWTSYTLDMNSGLLYVPGGNPAPDFAIGARGRQFLYRLGRRARCQDRGLQIRFQARKKGLARLGRLQPARPDSNAWRQAADGSCTERRIPLWLRSRKQQPALPRAGDPDRECRRNFLPRRGRPLLPGCGGRRGMEQPGL